MSMSRLDRWQSGSRGAGRRRNLPRWCIDPAAASQRLQAGAFQLGRHVTGELTRRLWLIVAHLAKQLASLSRPERQTAAEHLVEHHAQAVYVRAAVDAVRRAGNLLRGHVRRRARNHAELATARHGLVEAEPEVHEDRAAVRREDHVRRLDVAVDGEP